MSNKVSLEACPPIQLPLGVQSVSQSKKKPASVAAIFRLAKLNNHVTPADPPARRFLRRRPREGLRNTKQRIIALDRQKKILDRKTRRCFSRSCPHSTQPFRELSHRFYAHASEATRRPPRLQAQTLLNALTSSSRGLPLPIPAAFRSC